MIIQHDRTVPRPHSISARLLRWYPKHARDLPWRRTRDPYRIWVSEIMLQQTRAATAMPYWERWMSLFPTVQTLAAAPLSAVLKAWEGLGYYARARNLHAAAQRIVRDHSGQFPSQFTAVLDLPGIGSYTAGAICSIAFDQAQPILDGNVVRVLTRLHAVRSDVRKPKVRQRLWKLALELVEAAAARDPHSPSQLNQALMELGATVCTPRQPQCPSCPCRTLCRAIQTGIVHKLPFTGTRPQSIPRHFRAFVLAQDNRFLVRQRPAHGVNASLWEFPNSEVEPSRDRTAEDAIRTAERLLNLRVAAVTPLCTIRHTITRFRITLDVFALTEVQSPEGLGSWFTLAELEQLPFPSAHQRILKHLRRDHVRHGLC